MREREEALRQREETFRRRLNEELETEVRQARREIDDVIADLKAKSDLATQEAARPMLTTGDTGALRAEARQAVDSIVRKFAEPASQPARVEPAGQYACGWRPRGRRRPRARGGRHVGPRRHGGPRRARQTHAGRVRDLRVLAGPAADRPSSVTVHVELQPRDGSPSDLNVVGCTVDEAIARAERFLDESLLTDQRTVRLIHGYGTGQLKRALAGFLQQHPLVAQFGAAPSGTGRRRRHGRGAARTERWGLFPQTFIDDLRLQANILQVVQEYVPLKKVGPNRTRASARFTPRRRRRFTSIRKRVSFTASGAASAATSSSFSSFTRKLGFQDAVRHARPEGRALPCPSKARAGGDDATRRDAGCGKRC